VYSQHSKLSVRDSEIHGKGVFTDVTIGKNKLIEEILYHKLQPANCPKVLLQYSFSQNIKAPFYVALPLGYGAFYNSAQQPNAEMTFDWKNEKIIITSLRMIYSNEEITLKYLK